MSDVSPERTHDTHRKKLWRSRLGAWALVPSLAESLILFLAMLASMFSKFQNRSHTTRVGVGLRPTPTHRSVV